MKFEQGSRRGGVVMAGSERQEKAESLARDILTLARSSLLVHFRYLNRAMSHLELICDEMVSAATDGIGFYYNPWYILNVYRSESSAVAHDLLHSVLHCVFRHNFVGKELDRPRWDLAVDLAVEDMICQMEVSAVRVNRQKKQQGTLQLLHEELKGTTAERIYHWLGDKGLTEEELTEIREPFLADNHGLWYGEEKDAREDERVALRKQWEDVSRRMQTELETMQREVSGAMIQNLRQINKARHDYSQFLRRFGVHGEWMQLSEEEFDYNYYSYSQRLYDNVRLIEPLEYSQQKRIREFVIAIDTSGSVRGDVVQSFVQHTHDMLCQQGNFFQRVEMHIIQCDDCIREDVRICDREKFQEYVKTMEIKGLGKTDFRPVFAYVEELRRKGQLLNLQGLIYFTDGEGIYPAKKPDYDTAFILHNDGYEEPEVPSWAMSLTLREEDILHERFSCG